MTDTELPPEEAAAYEADHERRKSGAKAKRGRPSKKSSQEKSDSGEDEQFYEGNGDIRCICDFTDDDGLTIQCEKCLIWQHMSCLLIETGNEPEQYYCEQCAPRPVDRDLANDIQRRKRAREGMRRGRTRSLRPDEDLPEEDDNESIDVETVSDLINGYEFLQENMMTEEVSPVLEEIRQKVQRGAVSSFLLLQEQDLKNPQLFDVRIIEDVKKRRSVGLFAKKDISANAFLIEYTGKFKSKKIFKENPTNHFASHHQPFLFFHDVYDVVVDARHYGSESRFIRRGCSPNVEVKDVLLRDGDRSWHIALFAKESIKQGEELTLAYDYRLDEKTYSVPCNCHSRLCRTEEYYRTKKERKASLTIEQISPKKKRKLQEEKRPSLSEDLRKMSREERKIHMYMETFKHMENREKKKRAPLQSESPTRSPSPKAVSQDEVVDVTTDSFSLPNESVVPAKKAWMKEFMLKEEVTVALVAPVAPQPDLPAKFLLKKKMITQEFMQNTTSISNAFSSSSSFAIETTTLTSPSLKVLAEETQLASEINPDNKELVTKETSTNVKVESEPEIRMASPFKPRLSFSDYKKKKQQQVVDVDETKEPEKTDISLNTGPAAPVMESENTLVSKDVSNSSATAI